jgi:hypothetical protein
LRRAAVKLSNLVRRFRVPLWSAFAVSLFSLVGHLGALYGLWKLVGRGELFSILAGAVLFFDSPATFIYRQIGFGYGFEYVDRSAGVWALELGFYFIVLFLTWAIVFVAISAGARRIFGRRADRNDEPLIR